jgi:biopolymer transport protein ExbD
VGMATSSGGGINSDINVTPLVDVVLVLLIIFMVITPMLTRGYELDVPQKMENIEIPEDVIAEQLIVTYTAEEGIFINKDPVARIDLPTTLEQILSTRRKKTVFFAAARDLNYGDVVQVMDIVRTAGAEAIGLVTEDALSLPPDKQSAAAAEDAPDAAPAPSSQ